MVCVFFYTQPFLIFGLKCKIKSTDIQEMRKCWTFSDTAMRKQIFKKRTFKQFKKPIF